MEVYPEGKHIPAKGYEPSEQLKLAVINFAQACKNAAPSCIIEYGQTDRDVEIVLRSRVNPNTPFMNVSTFYVWEEDGKVVGSKADGGFGI